MIYNANWPSNGLAKSSTSNPVVSDWKDAINVPFLVAILRRCMLSYFHGNLPEYNNASLHHLTTKYYAHKSYAAYFVQVLIDGFQHGFAFDIQHLKNTVCSSVKHTRKTSTAGPQKHSYKTATFFYILLLLAILPLKVIILIRHYICKPNRKKPF